MTIDDELAALRKERPKPDTTMADALVDVIEAILLDDAVGADVTGGTVDRAVLAYLSAVNAHIDRRVSVYMRGAGEIAP